MECRIKGGLLVLLFAYHFHGTSVPVLLFAFAHFVIVFKIICGNCLLCMPVSVSKIFCYKVLRIMNFAWWGFLFLYCKLVNCQSFRQFLCGELECWHVWIRWLSKQNKMAHDFFRARCPSTWQHRGQKKKKSERSNSCQDYFALLW